MLAPSKFVNTKSKFCKLLLPWWSSFVFKLIMAMLFFVSSAFISNLTAGDYFCILYQSICQPICQSTCQTSSLSICLSITLPCIGLLKQATNGICLLSYNVFFFFSFGVVLDLLYANETVEIRAHIHWHLKSIFEISTWKCGLKISLKWNILLKTMWSLLWNISVYQFSAQIIIYSTTMLFKINFLSLRHKFRHKWEYGPRTLNCHTSA